MKAIVSFCMLLCMVVAVKAQLTNPHVAAVYDSAWTYKNLRLIPIRFMDTCQANSLLPKGQYMSLAEALQHKKAEVKEFIYNGDGDVHILTIKNNSNKNILVNDGELLQGGKQDRMIGETRIIEPGKEEQFLKTYCIEKGRWDKKPRAFTYGGVADSRLRKTMDSTGNQQAIWKEIELQFTDSGKQSDTWPYLQLKNPDSKIDSAYLDYFLQRFQQSDSSYAGFIAVSGNQVIGADLFATRELTTIAFENIVQGYILAIGDKDGQALPLKKEKEFTDKLLGSTESQRKLLEKHGKQFMHQGKPLHITAYGF